MTERSIADQISFCKQQAHLALVGGFYGDAAMFRSIAETLRQAEVGPRPDPAPWQEPQMEELIAIYEEIKSLWAAMCFDWMFAPENMKREAHGQIRDGLNEVARRLFQIVGPALKAEFTEASRLAREAAALPVPPERPPAERQD